VRTWKYVDEDSRRSTPPGVAGDPGAMFDSEALAPDAEWIPPSEASAGVRSVYRGREEFAEFMRTWTEDFEDYSVWLEEMIDAGGDRVVGLFHHRATEKGSGVPVELHMALVYQVQEGRIVRIWNFIDPAEAFAAVGLTEQPAIQTAVLLPPESEPANQR
jgi:ketosteroid isomerase-like protein